MHPFGIYEVYKDKSAKLIQLGVMVWLSFFSISFSHFFHHVAGLDVGFEVLFQVLVMEQLFVNLVMIIMCLFKWCYKNTFIFLIIFAVMFNLVYHSRIENNNKEKYIMQRESKIHPVMNLFLRNCTEKAGEHSFTQIKPLPH